MGLNLIPYLLGEEEVGEYGNKYLSAERYHNFDTVRMSGDTDFVTTEDLDWEYRYDDESKKHETVYMRPIDLIKAKLWIISNVYGGGKSRLYKLIEDMEQMQNLYIYISW